MNRKPVRIVLVGLPGSGKSSAGEALAKRLGWSFFDLDRLIEKQSGRTIPEIFAAVGEAGFRRLERDVTAWVAKTADVPFVVATGGGWIMDVRNVKALRRPGRMVYLKVSPEVALKRMGTAAGGRPLLLGDDPLARLKRLAARREPVYALSDAVVDTETLDVEEVTNRLVFLASSLMEE